jgi:cytosine/creatinine deaminase
VAGGRKAKLTALRFPWRSPFHLVNIRVPTRVTSLESAPDHEGCVPADLTIGKDGRIEDIGAPGTLTLRSSLVQGHGRQVWPSFVDIHAHLDKTGTWDRAPNEDGSFDGAVAASRAARRQPWSEADVLARMDEAADEAHRMGTAAIRTHIDSSPQRWPVSWSAFTKLKRRWRDRMTIQGVVLFGAQELMGRAGETLADLASAHGAALGPVIYPSTAMEQDVARAFELAERRGLDLDFHVDETGGADAHGLDRIAALAVERGFRGRIVCGHACSLSLHDDTSSRATIAKLQAAKIGVVTLPATNLYLQARKPGVTPIWRGVTRLHELRAGGVDVAIAGDNRRDAFYPFGDYDMLDVFRDAVRIAHLDMPMAGWVDAVSAIPARMMGLPDQGSLSPGAPADLVLFPVRTAAEVFATRGTGRQILRMGRVL